MKNWGILIIMALLLAPAAAGAQAATSYFMDHTVERYSLNPAFAPTRNYFALPAIGSTAVSLNTNGLTVGNFLYPRGGELVTFLDAGVDGDKFLSKLPANKLRLGVDVQVNLLKWGWWRRKTFWNIGAALRTTASVKIPVDLLRLMKNGTGHDGDTFDMNRLKMGVDSYIELSLGATTPLDNDRWTVGVRPKILLGLGAARGGINSMCAEMSGTRWRIAANGGFTTAMNGLKLTESESGAVDGAEYSMPKGLSDIPDLISGVGLAVDAGAQYKLTERITLSASALDLGFLNWGAKGVNRYAAKGGTEFNGFDAPVDEIDEDLIQSQIDGMVDDLEKMAEFRDAKRPGVQNTALSPRILVGGEYELPAHNLSFGLLSSTRFFYAGVMQELTASVNYQPARWFGTSLSYSMIHGYNAIGFAINLSPKGFNLFVGTDYAPFSVNPWGIPIQGRGVNVNLGVALTFGALRE